MTTPQIGIIMGSQSDWPTLKPAAETLDALGHFGNGGEHCPGLVGDRSAQRGSLPGSVLAQDF